MKLPSAKRDGFVDRSPLLADSDSEVSSFLNSNESRLNNIDDNASQEIGDSSSYNHVDDVNHNEVLSYHNVATTWLHPYSSTKLYIHDLSENFTAKFVAWLAIYNCFIIGGTIDLQLAMSLPLFKALGISASRTQLYISMQTAPWAMNSIVGVMSDLFPLLGYHKRYLASLANLIGIAGCSALLVISSKTDIALLDGEASNQTLADCIVICLIAVSYTAMVGNVVGWGKAAELMRLNPQTGSSIVSFGNWWRLIGKLIGQSLAGVLAFGECFKVFFVLLLSFSLTPLLPTLFGWIPEEKRNRNDPGMISLCGPWLLFDKKALDGKETLFMFITVSGLFAPLLAFITTYTSLQIGLLFATVCIVATFVANYVVFPMSVSRK